MHCLGSWRIGMKSPASSHTGENLIAPFGIFDLHDPPRRIAVPGNSQNIETDCYNSNSAGRGASNLYSQSRLAR